MSNEDSPADVPRSTYRHGDLRRALLEAGLALAREGGPDAIVLREATRRAKVVPNAAYRHFAGHRELFDAVRAAALGALAKAIELEWDKADAIPDAAERARAQLSAVGAGYMGFAQAETGLFRTAFAPRQREGALQGDPARTGSKGLGPFGLLNAALDAMVQTGALPAERRPGAEYLAWSAVHGMALLIIDGPLHSAPAETREALGKRLLHMVERGL
ncbi:TetR-like C-terminal domain-containing protein [Ottowia thiooxydans]|uniref:TetR-like C-terminal domain-containing protein n=1 Tax=Ottowia thiooxydans TaxID=219182 RepID=UPI0003F7B067|nr:TetR-like C-terminal domain-containing protein [Ottowia thiooxydans]